MNRLEKWCQMCGAAPGEPCRVISGGDGLNPGDERPEPHFYRSADAKPGVLIPDEPEFADGLHTLSNECRCHPTVEVIEGAATRSVVGLGFVIENQVILMQAAWIEWKHGRGAEAAMEWIENCLDGPNLIPFNEENGADAQAYYDRLIGDSRDRQSKAEARLGRSREDRLRLWRNMGNDPVAIPYNLDRLWDGKLSHADRTRLWRGMGNAPADLTADISDDDLHAMVARFTSNA